MQKVSYGERKVLMEEITKTSKGCCAEGRVLGKSRASFACENGDSSRSGVIISSSVIYWAVGSVASSIIFVVRVVQL